MHKILLATLISWFIIEPAHADMSGNTLKKFCDEPSKPGQEGFGKVSCAMYIVGTLDAYRMSNTVLSPKLFCEQNGVEGEQIIALVQREFLMHPEKLHLNAAGIIGEMMIKTFPCK